MQAAVTAIQNVPYVFTLDRVHDDPSFSFYDVEARDILCHVKYRTEDARLAFNVRLTGEWQSEQTIGCVASPGNRVELRFAPYKVWLRFGSDVKEMALPFREVAERIGSLTTDGFSEAANLLQSDFMAIPMLKQGMTSIEYAIVDARLRRIEMAIAAMAAPAGTTAAAAPQPVRASRAR